MVHRVANQVHQRVTDLLDYGLIQFGIFAHKVQLDLLAQFTAQVVNSAAKAPEDKGDRQHPHPHDMLLQIAGMAFQLVYCGFKPIAKALQQ